MTPAPLYPHVLLAQSVGRDDMSHSGVVPSLNEPALDLTGGTLYQTGTDVRLGIRWENEENRLVKRLFTLTADAS